MPPTTPSRLPARMPAPPPGAPATARLFADTSPDTEAFQELLSLARGKTGKIPADALVRHLAVTAQADWPVARAAMEALLRRFAFARRDELRVASRPTGARRAVSILRAAPEPASGPM